MTEFEEMNLIGIDSATKDENIEIARGTLVSGILRIESVRVGDGKRPILDTLINWIEDGSPSLIAIDAPLGWPERLGPLLDSHTAGASVEQYSNQMFRRETDAFVHRQTRHRPLDVGADRIARTCLATLHMLYLLRKQTGEEIPLAWGMTGITRLSVIEVYPAATLVMHALPSRSYKRPDQAEARRDIAAGLSRLMVMPNSRELLRSDANALDAAICVLAAADFAIGEVWHPENLLSAKKEGWIWVRKGNRDTA